ncbi:MAG: hypothetical protein U9R44_03125 [Candidatus Omnitrophota bacterium]|nr:hypothetical protein [Candidatus Omnitrophota bacterium]
MSDLRRNILSVSLVCVFLLFATYLLVFFNAGRVAAFSIDHFTDYRLSYGQWTGNPIGKSEIDGLSLDLKGKSITVRADKALLNCDARKLLWLRQLNLECEMGGVSLTSKGETVPFVVFSDNVLANLFGPDQKYEKIIFTLFLDEATLKITGFKAYSKDVRIQGDFTLLSRNDEISIEFKISFSPEISSTFTDDIREKVLSPDEGGWYSTIISYQGNPLFLKALYSLAF